MQNKVGESHYRISIEKLEIIGSLQQRSKDGTKLLLILSDKSTIPADEAITTPGEVLKQVNEKIKEIR